MHICVILPAAGHSTRFSGGDKLDQDLGGRALLLRTVELFTKREEVGSVIVAGPPETLDAFKERYGASLSFHGAIIVEGGRTARWETVRNALNAVPADATHVAVHDAARPATSTHVLDRVFEAARKLDAVIPVVSINATVKRVGGEPQDVADHSQDALADAILGDSGRNTIHARPVEATLAREGLVEVQTPQVFAAALIKRAYEQPSLGGVTDDAGLVERLGEPVHAVEGDPRNIKVTTQADLHLVRAILNLKPPARRPAHKRF